MSHTVSLDQRTETRARIVDVAAGLLAEHGAHALTTRAVANAAGIQAPTIYRLFGDKDGLVDAVAEHVMAQYVVEKTPVDVAVDPVDELRRAWHAHIDFGVTNAHLFALLNAPDRAHRSPATAAGVEVLRARVRRIAEAGRLRVSEERAVQMIHAAGTGTVLALIGQPASLRDHRLATAMFDAVTAGILTASSAKAAPKTATAIGPVAITFLTMIDDLPSLSDAERAVMAEWIRKSIGRLAQ